MGCARSYIRPVVLSETPGVETNLQKSALTKDYTHHHCFTFTPQKRQPFFSGRMEGSAIGDRGDSTVSRFVVVRLGFFGSSIPLDKNQHDHPACSLYTWLPWYDVIRTKH